MEMTTNPIKSVAMVAFKYGEGALMAFQPKIIRNEISSRSGSQARSEGFDPGPPVPPLKLGMK